MRGKLSKMPPLSGDAQQKCEQLRNYYNKLIDDLTRVLEAQEKELERLRKETRK